MAQDLTFNIKLKNDQAKAELNELLQEALAGSREAQYAFNQRAGGQVVTEWYLETKVKDDGTRGMALAAKEVLTEYDKIERAQKKLNQSQIGSVTNLRQSVNQAKQFRDGIVKIATVTDTTAGTVAGKLNPAWELADQKVQSLSRQLASAEGGFLNIAKANFPIIGKVLKLGNAFTQVTFIAKGVIEVFQAINAAVQPIIIRAKQLEGLSLSLRAFVSSQSDVSAVMSSAKGIALEYGVSLTQIEKAYKRVAPAILASGGSLGDVEAVVESLSAKTVQLGLNTEQSGRYIEAFAQVMGKGKLQSEELNQQFSELDGALRSQVALYLETNHGITDLNQAMKNGEVTAGLFREAFIAAAQSAKDELAGAIGQVQGRIDELNIQQIENIRQTLGTITLEGLSKSTEDFGMAMQRVSTLFSQFFAAVATNMPNFQKYWNGIGRDVGRIVELITGGFLAGLMIIFKTADLIQGVIAGIWGWLQKIVPFLGPIVQGLQGIGDWFMNSFRQGVDMILQLGESAKVSKGGFDTLQASATLLKAQLDSGAISTRQYDEAMKRLYQDATNGSKNALTAFQEEEAQLKALKEEINARFDEEKEKIQGLIDKKKEALQTEKDALAEVKEALKTAYDERKQQITDEIAAVKERYALELQNATQLTTAQKEEVRLRREKLKATINSSKATYEEKIQAQATLDRLDQQVKVNEIKKRQAEELKAKEKEKADAERKYNEDKKRAEQESKKRQDEITGAIKALTETLKTNEEKQKLYNKQIKESTRLTDEQIDSLDDIPGLLQQQITKVSAARDKYWEASRAASALADQVERANRAQASAPATRRASGGPVVGGQTYTVNEFGKEGFLSASGKLSQINAPAWGAWRAPSAGTVIPADIFATVKATSGPGGIARGMGMASSAQGSGAAMLRALSALTGGDNIQNNVTIQAANTTQAASDMLVSLTRIKRRRYR